MKAFFVIVIFLAFLDSSEGSKSEEEEEVNIWIKIFKKDNKNKKNTYWVSQNLPQICTASA